MKSSLVWTTLVALPGSLCDFLLAISIGRDELAIPHCQCPLCFPKSTLGRVCGYKFGLAQLDVIQEGTVGFLQRIRAYLGIPYFRFVHCSLMCSACFDSTAGAIIESHRNCEETGEWPSDHGCDSTASTDPRVTYMDCQKSAL